LEGTDESSLSDGSAKLFISAAIEQHHLHKSIFRLLSMKDISVLLGCRRIETRARLAGIEFAMPDDACLGIDLMQQLQNLIQDDHLLGRAIVLVLVFGTARVATFVADPDTVRVVALDVTPSLTDRSTIVETTIPSHIKVITRIGAEAASTMTAHQLLDGEVLVGTRVRAVQHQQVNSPR
jgi:spore maturation protein SpmA